MFDFKNKIVVVTGGAQGIGKCICEEFKKAGADLVTIHLEACEDVEATIAKIRECGCKVGISICPDTPVASLENYVEKVDMVLIMSVNPGFAGQKIVPLLI